MTNQIQLFTPYFRTEETLAAIRECLDRGWSGIGFRTIDFEKAWLTYTGLQTAHFLNSATAGLHLAVHQMKKKYGWRDGDQIITTPLTFVSTNHAILHEGLQPVFADVDQYLCLDPDSVEERITPRTRAVIFVGLGGNTGQFTKLFHLCFQRNIPIILDAAHMAGTRWSDNGTHVGYYAEVSVFSFQAVKNLPTGDSGMICWHNKEMDEESRHLSWMGINKDTYQRSQGAGYNWEYDVEDVGWKYHGNSIMAAIGMVSLKYLNADNYQRRQICAEYDAMLADHPEIERVPMSPDCIPSRHLYQVMVDNRNQVFDALKAVGIGTGVHYIDNTQYKMYSGDCPNAARASKRLLSLPLHLKLGWDDVHRVAQELIKAVERVSVK